MATVNNPNIPLMQMVVSFAHITKCGLGLDMVECRTLFCDTMVLHNARLTPKRRRHKKASKKLGRMQYCYSILINKQG